MNDKKERLKIKINRLKFERSTCHPRNLGYTIDKLQQAEKELAELESEDE